MNEFFAKHKIFRALGPLVIALILVVAVFLSPLTKAIHYGPKQLKLFASDAKSRTMFVGYSAKSQVLQKKQFLPILGSSELEHFNSFHPSVYAAKYKTSWTPMLAGQPGTQSLTQYFYVNSIGKELDHRKLVFIISPQWFKPQGIPTPYLENFVSKGELYTWLLTANPKKSEISDLACYLLTIKSFTDDDLLGSCLKNIAAGLPLNHAQRLAIRTAESFWKREDTLFTYTDTFVNDRTKAQQKIKKFTKYLPKSSNPERLEAVAIRQGKHMSTNNPYHINNGTWRLHKHLIMAQKGKMTNISYLSSPEYYDFQQLLTLFAKHHVDVDFVIQPVNGYFDEQVTGAPYQAFADFSRKITYQLNSQGFHNVLDLTDKFAEPYYSGDTIHFGTRGWLAVDLQIDKFMKQPFKANYKLDNRQFLSKEWEQEQENF